MSVYTDKSVLVTGAGGFLGKHVVRLLEQWGAWAVPFQGDLLPDPLLLTGMDADALHGIDLVIHLAAIVKGAAPNRTQPWRFARNNTLLALHAIDLALWLGVPMVAAGSVCAYPEDAPVPFEEKDFWQGKPDSNNLGYGLAKRWMAGALESAAIQQKLRYVHLISANLYGPGDHLGEDAHVIPSLLHRIEQARLANEPSVSVWGSGKPTRDFLYVEDAAEAYVLAGAYLLQGGESLECNIGSGREVSIAHLADLLRSLTAYRGTIDFDTAKPDGQMRRKIDIHRAATRLGWEPRASLEAGLRATIDWYRGRLT